ncbi:MAG: hypothetical protein ACRDFX_00985 [Chloroflexota bacterium]
MDEWIIKLRSAVEAGYYRTEVAAGEQTRFPWQGKTCGDCPFWHQRVCAIYETDRSPESHTCAYFDDANRAAGTDLLARRRRVAFRRWWDGFNHGHVRM